MSVLELWSPLFFTQESGAVSPFGTLSIAFGEQVNTAEAAATEHTAELDDDEADRPDDSTLLQGEIRSSATFLLGARTRFGRVVRFNPPIY